MRLKPPYAWQKDSWQALRNRQRQDRLTPSLLVTGQEGIGKYRFCEALAHAALCERDGDQACGECNACRQLAAGSHPDFLQLSVQEGKREILIDQIRDFCGRIQLTASQTRGRYAIIRGADRLNIAAANALLKTLEEPPRGAHILLTANQFSRIPATIRSRCARVAMPPPSREQAEDWLRQWSGDQQSQWPMRRIGPCNLQEEETGNAADFLRQEKQWQSLLQDLERGGDCLALAAQLDEKDFDIFLRWWQEQLLEELKQGRRSMRFRRIWDALITLRRKGLGNMNRLLALEGLFILYQNLLSSAATGVQR